jgi:hypothetical protein
VDDLATEANLEQAITQWAVNHVGPDQLFTLYMMDHGDYDVFHLDGTVGKQITPTEISGWLAQLEAAVSGVEVNVVVDACHSGSFIDPLHTVSQEGRVVIASTGANNLAYADQEGALFSSAFFNQLRQRISLRTAFEEGKWAVEQAHPDQTPWLDGDGDGTPNEAEDEQGATGREFACARLPEPEQWSPYIELAEVRQLDVVRGRGQIWARVQDDERVAKVWVLVYPPSYPPPEPGEELEAEPMLREYLSPQTNDWYGKQYNTFDEMGEYRLVIYAEDDAGLAARPLEVKVQVGWPVYLPLVMR